MRQRHDVRTAGGGRIARQLEIHRTTGPRHWKSTGVEHITFMITPCKTLTVLKPVQDLYKCLIYTLASEVLDV